MLLKSQRFLSAVYNSVIISTIGTEEVDQAQSIERNFLTMIYGDELRQRSSQVTYY